MSRGLSQLQKSILEMAYRNRLLEWEPRPKTYRVEVYDRPEDKDLRALVPEAFEVFPDGYWTRHKDPLLIAGSFRDRDEAEAFARDLDVRGLNINGVSHLSDGRVYTHISDTNTEYLWDLFCTEVYCELYGFKRGAHWWAKGEPTRSLTDFPRARIARKWDNIHADDEPNYKHPKYASARAAVSRAFKRLEARALVEHVWGRVRLTDSGVEVARDLTVNGAHNVLTAIHNGAAKEMAVNEDGITTLVNQCEKQALERLAAPPPPPPPSPPTPEEEAQRQANIAAYKRNMFVEGIYRNIAGYIVEFGTGPDTNADVEAMFAEAMQRVQEKIDEAVNEDDRVRSDNRCEEVA